MSPPAGIPRPLTARSVKTADSIDGERHGAFGRAGSPSLFRRSSLRGKNQFPAVSGEPEGEFAAAVADDAPLFRPESVILAAMAVTQRAVAVEDRGTVIFGTAHIAVEQQRLPFGR